MLLDKEVPNFNVTHFLGDTDESRPETRSKILKTLLLVEKRELQRVVKKDFDSVSNLSVTEVTLDKAIVDHGISAIDEGL